MTVEIHCEGAPRDLGLDQGRACRAELRARFGRGRWWQRWRQQVGLDGTRAALLTRDLTRHFPQQSETIEGMVRGAGIPYGWFAETLVRELAAEVPTRVGGAVALAGEPPLTAGGSLVARTLACEPIVRRSEPEGGFSSVELTLPWLTAALAGVNEGGLAAVSVSLPGALASASCAVPAALLVQDCLARFDSIGGAVEWCTGRSAGGRAAIALADAAGGVVAVEVDGDTRRVVRPKDGFVLVGGARDAADALGAGAPLARISHQVAPAVADLRALAKILGARIAGIDPAGRRIALLDASAASVDCFEVGE
jgi:hypothetical protein